MSDNIVPDRTPTDISEPVVLPPAINLLDYKEARPVIDEIANEWSSEVSQTEANRNARAVDLDVAGMREAGKIDADETFIPERLIDSSITREQPSYLAFLNKSRRLAIFRSLDNPNQDTQRLEEEFTQGLTYPGWLKEFNKFTDGALLHGWDSLEVVFDTTKPLNVGFEHIGHDRLFFNKNVPSIQDSELVIRSYDITAMRLLDFSKAYAFNIAEVKNILASETDVTKATVTYNIYRVFMKINGIVYVAWCAGGNAGQKCNDWLKAPAKFRIGISEWGELPPPVLPEMHERLLEGENTSSKMQGGTLAPQSLTPSELSMGWIDSDVDMYPIFILEYKDTEEDAITDHVGRAFLDGPRQEAHTCIVTAFVNALNRASNTMAAPDGATDDVNESVKELNITLRSGALYNRPLKFFHMDYPPVEVLTALQQLDVRNMQQSGQVDYAVMNRKDARKTATELQQAQQESELVKSTPIALYSECLRGIFTFSWRIVQSQALKQQIKFLLTSVPITVSGPTGPIVIGQEFKNDEAIIKQQYDVRAAGDIDFVQRMEKITQMMNDWPVIQTTGASMLFLQDLVRLKYPDVGERYAELIASGDPVKNLLRQVSMILQGAIQPEEFKALDPAMKQQLLNVQKQVQQVLGEGQGGPQQ